MAPPFPCWWMVLFQCLIHFRLADAAGSKCYYPDGSEATSDSPCNTDADASACCSSSSDSTCLNNELCEDGQGRVIRGSCSDQSWSDPACPRYCLSFKFGGEDLIPCNNVTRDNVSYCCDGGIANCCDSGDGRFEVLPYPTSAIATWNSASTQFMILPGVQTSATSLASSSSTVLSVTTTSSSPATSSATTTSLHSPSPMPVSSSDDAGLSTGGKIGIGVGVAGGVLLAALLAYLIWRVHQTHNTLKQQQAINARETTSHPPSAIVTDSGLSQSYQYKGPDSTFTPPAQPASYPELSAEARTYELPTSPR